MHAPVVAASISTHAMVASEDPNGKMNDETSDVAPHSGKKPIFIVPYPGVNGTVAGVLLDGKQIVLAGIFPEVGSGARLLLDSERTKHMIQDFVRRVTMNLSGKSDFFLVGQDPGRSIVSAADARGVPLIDLLLLQRLLMGKSSM
jgi:BRCT domain type II-containing protein